MLTIHDLQIQFDVAGQDDATFSRLFAEHIGRWSQARETDQTRRRRMERERSLGDQQTAAAEADW